MRSPAWNPEHGCAWDRGRSVDGIALGAVFRPGARFILAAVDDEGRSQDYADPLADIEVHVVDGVVISVTCHRAFRVGQAGENLIGRSLVEFEEAVGAPFVPDDGLGRTIYGCDELHLSCIAFEDGRVVQVSIADFDLIADGPDPRRASGSG